MNKLQNECSPYLRQHAGNPVHWEPWRQEALEKASRLHKPILVSIGYSSCHWCHVMAHESFEDPETAVIMNEHFVCIKIDREERPDLDHYFMNAVQAMGFSGGWPLHCFLSEDGQPFFGGTYFPPDPKYGRPSWKMVLLSVAETYRNKPGELIQQAGQLVTHLQNLSKLTFRRETSLERKQLEECIDGLMRSADAQHGGFGSSPKFPQPTGLQLLLAGAQIFKRIRWREFAEDTLMNMGGGGIYDHLGGGLCRYSVDGMWDVPHFEKMLYDNAQWVTVLCQTYGQCRNEFLKFLALDTLQFWESQMQDQYGYFWSSQDADSEGEEGKFYTWEMEELRNMSQERFNYFSEWFDWVSLDHRFPNRKVVRFQKNKLQSTDSMILPLKVQELREILELERSNRIPPAKDQKGIIAWNAMLVSSYVSVFLMTKDKVYLDKAKRLLEVIQHSGIFPDGSLARYMWEGKPVGNGFLEDYAFFAKAFMDCYQLSFDKGYIEKAIHWYTKLVELFGTNDSPLFWTASKVYGDNSYNSVEWADAQYASANAIICDLARYLYIWTGENSYKLQFEQMISSMQAHCEKYPLATSSWLGQHLANLEGHPMVKTSNIQNGLDILDGWWLPTWFILPEQEGEDGVKFCTDHHCLPPITEASQWHKIFNS